jgi:hypothetical protein
MSFGGKIRKGGRINRKKCKERKNIDKTEVIVAVNAK